MAAVFVRVASPLPPSNGVGTWNKRGVIVEEAEERRGERTCEWAIQDTSCE